MSSSNCQVPILFVCGATGTGKTKLGVELASRFNGEVINVDVIQMYKGLDIATNKVTSEEMCGVPHHLIGFLDPRDPDFTIHQFHTSALDLITDISRRGKSPVLVGGTHYYLESILWDFLYPHAASHSHIRQESFSGLTNEQLHQRLEEIDTEAARHIHPNDRRKVNNALQIAVERAGKSFRKKEEIRFPGRTIGFWMDSRTDILHDRLDKRVNSMVENGLIAEMRKFHDEENVARKEWKEGMKERFEVGIWQAIGFKELEPFFTLTREEQDKETGEKILQDCLERLRLSTRQYARRQLKWINNRFLNRTDMDVIPIFRMDSSDPSQWTANVSDRVITIYNFWCEHAAQCDVEQDWWTNCPVQPEPVRKKTGLTYITQQCEECNRVFTTQEEFDIHMASRRHKKRSQSLRRAKARTVPVADQVDDCKDESATVVDEKKRKIDKNSDDFASNPPYRDF